MVVVLLLEVGGLSFVVEEDGMVMIGGLRALGSKEGKTHTHTSFGERRRPCQQQSPKTRNPEPKDHSTLQLRERRK